MFIHTLAKQGRGLSSRDFCNTFCRQKKSTQKLLRQRILAEQSTGEVCVFAIFLTKNGPPKPCLPPYLEGDSENLQGSSWKAHFFFNFFFLKNFFRSKIFSRKKYFYRFFQKVSLIHMSCPDITFKGLLNDGVTSREVSREPHLAIPARSHFFTAAPR